MAGGSNRPYVHMVWKRCTPCHAWQMRSMPQFYRSLSISTSRRKKLVRKRRKQESGRPITIDVRRLTVMARVA